MQNYMIADFRGYNAWHAKNKNGYHGHTNFIMPRYIALTLPPLLVAVDDFNEKDLLFIAFSMILTFAPHLMAFLELSIKRFVIICRITMNNGFSSS